MDSHQILGAADGMESTGVGEVDEMLADLAGLDAAPVSDHVAVFERAHERLRRALDSSPGD